MRTSIRNAVRTSGALLILALALSGCSTPPWITPTASPTASPTSTEVPQPVPNDLSSGSTARGLTAGPLTISIDYWSTLTMDKWTADALKPVSISMITQITPNDGQKVYLQRATMVATPMSATETLEPLSAQVDSATTNPGYLVLDPYSYSQTFTVGPTPEGRDARLARVHVRVPRSGDADLERLRQADRDRHDHSRHHQVSTVAITKQALGSQLAATGRRPDAAPRR